MPEDEANFIASDATSQILRYKIAAVGCLPGEGLHSNGKECTACPEHFVSPYVGPALTAVDTEQPSPSIPSTCTRCPAGKTLPEGSELPNFKGLELLECAFHLDGKTSDGNKTHMKCPHVGYGKQSEVFSVIQVIFVFLLFSFSSLLSPSLFLSLALFLTVSLSPQPYSPHHICTALYLLCFYISISISNFLSQYTLTY